MGTYICTLDKKTVKKAKEELNEDPKQRASQIQTLRDWAESQPHLRSRLGKCLVTSLISFTRFLI